MDETRAEPRQQEAEPFGPEALEPSSFKGCSRPVLIGCGAIFVLLALVFLFFLFKAGDLVRWSLVMFQRQVEEQLPGDVTEEERERLDLAFHRALAAIEDGTANQEALPEFQRTLLATSRKIESLTREDVLELIEALEALARAPAAESARAPRPPPASSAASTCVAA